MTTRTLLRTALAAALACAPAAAFDRVLLKDGRVLEGSLVEGGDAAVVQLKVKDYVVPIPAAEVEQTFVEDLANFKPRNAQEEEYLKKGWVLFEGRWMSRDRRKAELDKRAAADKAAVEDLKKRSNWKNAVSKESTHFKMKTNAEDVLVAEYLDRLEQFYKVFSDDWGVKISPAKGGKLPVELHRSWGDFLNISFSGGQVFINFNGGDGAINLWYDEDDPDDTLADLYNGAAYQFLFFVNTKFWYPSWIRSGLSAYYATTVRGEDGKLQFGAPQYGLVQLLDQARGKGAVPPIIEVLDSEDTDWTAYHSAARWSFVHFLLESPEYGKPFRAFVANLPNNKDAGIHQVVPYWLKGATLDVVDARKCVSSLEKRLGASLAKIEQDWRAAIEQPVPMTPRAFYLAGDAALDRARYGDDGGDDSEQQQQQDEDERAEQARAMVVSAFDSFQKAWEGGLANDLFLRTYAELLRLGGVTVEDGLVDVRPPDPARALEVALKAIQVDPVEPYNYLEAADALLAPGPQQDFEKAGLYAEVAKVVGGTRNGTVKALAEAVFAQVEPAREAAREQAEAFAEAAANDSRLWHVAFFFIEGQPRPENLTDLSTAELRDLIRTGKVKAEDHVYQAWRDADPESGELVEGPNPWDKGWVKVKDCPLFAAELAEAQGKPGG